MLDIEAALMPRKLSHVLCPLSHVLCPTSSVAVCGTVTIFFRFRIPLWKRFGSGSTRPKVTYGPCGSGSTTMVSGPRQL